jgi:hypothetical protein
LNGRIFVRSSQTGGLGHLGPDVYNDEQIYFNQRDTLAASPWDTAKAGRFTYYTGKYPYLTRPELQVEGAIGGSLSTAIGAYLTGGYFQSSYRLPNQFTRRVNGSLKLNFDFSPGMRLNLIGLLEDRGELFGWKNTVYHDDFRFFLEGVPQWSGYNLTGSLKWTHLVSPKSFYEIQVSAVTDQTFRGYSDDDGDGIMTPQEAMTTDGDYMEFADTAQVNANMPRWQGTEWEKFFTPRPRGEPGSEVGVNFSGQGNWKIARPAIYYEDFLNINYTLKADVTSQITENHQLRGGLQLRLHDLDMVRRAAYAYGVFRDYKPYVDENWHVRPAEYSAYIQDRMEYDGLIVNIGLRLDGLNNNLADIANWFAPFVDGSDGFGPARFQARSDTKAPIIWFLSPRLSVGHPISDRASMYFSYSRQQQNVPFSQIYTNYHDFGNPSLPQLMRAGQEPIRSTSYDLGLQWAFTDSWGVNVNVYYKDIDNYRTQGLNISPAAPWRNYIITTNFGYADARGLEVTILRSAAPIADWLELGGRLAYTYSYIKQTIIAGSNKSRYSTREGDSLLYGGQIPWDDLRYWNVIEQNVQGGRSTLTGGYDRRHRLTYSIALKFPADIVLSGVGTHSSGFFYRRTEGDPRARGIAEGPWNNRVDVRIEKGFTIGGVGRIALFADLFNAFNSRNVIAYNTSNVGQLAWERDGDPTGGPTINRPVGKSLGGFDGTLVYDIPREFYFGLDFTF